MEKRIMKGNEAMAEGAIRGGCRFYAGYPITPQSEILQWMSWRQKEVGGVFIQGASEIESVNMTFAARCLVPVRSLPHPVRDSPCIRKESLTGYPLKSHA